MLTDKIAIISGGTAGIGLGVARVFVDQGATVVLAGRSEERGAAALYNLAAGSRARYVRADVTRRADIDHLVSTTVDAFGHLDIVVNNAAGIYDARRIDSITADDEFEKIYRWNVSSAVWAIQAALKHMLPRGSGRIINVTSVAGLVGFPFAASYVASKHAIVGLTKAVAHEVGYRRVTVNAVAPGYVETDLAREFFPTVATAMGIELSDLIPRLTAGLGRPIRPEEIGTATAMLASDGGGGVNGAVIAVDGGYTSM